MEIAVHIAIGLLLLIVGAEALVRGASSLAFFFGIPPIVVGLTIVALGTSAPELAVSLKASLDGNSEIAISNIVGSNIFNTLFILGLSSVIIPLRINISVIQKEIPFLIFVSFLFFVFLWNNTLSKAEGIALLILCVGYTYFLIRAALADKMDKEPLPQQQRSAWVSTTKILAGLVAVAYGAKFLVLGSTEVARSLGVSETVIGLTIVACGTSLPEVMASVVATIRGERDLAIGNVVGSNIYNILAIGGISGAVSDKGLTISKELQSFDIPFMFFATFLCLLFFKSGKILSRPEGSFFIISFTAYIVWRVWSAL